MGVTPYHDIAVLTRVIPELISPTDNSSIAGKVLHYGEKDMGELKTYRTKRNFRSTKEPKGNSVARKAIKRRFVIQKHAASHLHYDFRLELDGVLKSWAVPKGPSLDPVDKRLAMHVEDHPIEYRSFEGTIPEGEYGAGEVIVWDRGTWEAEDKDVEKAYESGRLTFTLRGEKLAGKWMLVRFGAERRIGKQTWLLRKISDEYSRSSREYDILEEQPQSVISGKSLDASSRRTNAAPRKMTSKASDVPPRSRFNSHGVPPGKVEHLPFQLATLVDEIPTTGKWSYEVKYDGYRIQAHVGGGRVLLVSRNGKDYTEKFPEIVEKLSKTKGGPFIFDGEVVAQNSEGQSNFQLLQNAMSSDQEVVTRYFVFDILFDGKRDCRSIPFSERRNRLNAILGRASSTSPVVISRQLEGTPDELREAACKLGLEGIIGKRLSSIYSGRRSTDWVKVKCSKRQEFVIGGFTRSRNKSYPFGALLIGVYERGALRYCGKVGTGFTVQSRKALARAMKPIRRTTSPFNGPVDPADARMTSWVEPRLVAEVAFAEWTNDGHLRHPSFQGVREDKPAAAIHVEKEVRVDRVASLAAKKTASHARPAGGRGANVLGVPITHPDREIVEGSGVTKQKLAEFYAEFSSLILPYYVDRPLVLVRCPGGKKCFYQKHATPSIPDSIPIVSIKENSGKNNYLFVTKAEHLVELVQLNVVEFHAWGCGIQSIEFPDQVVLDLDPDPSLPWNRVVNAAKDLRKLLEDLGLECFLKCTGGKGIHLVIPIAPKYEWDRVKAWSEGIASIFSKRHEGEFTTNISKSARRGKIFVDYLRNGRGASAILPFSPRAREGAPFSLPISWSQLGKKPLHVSLPELSKRLRKGSVFEGYARAEGQTLTVLE